MGNSKRLLIVITLADWGGAQTFIFKAAREAQRRGWEVLLTFGGEGLMETKCRDAGVPFRKLKQMKREISPIHDIGVIRELVGIIHEWKPDTLLLNSSKAGVVGSIAGRIARVPKIIYRIGGWSFTDPVSPLQKTIRRWTERLTAPLKDTIVVNTPDGVDLAHTHHIHPRGEVVLVPNGMELQAFDTALLPRDTARQELGGTDHAPLLFTIANFFPAKGLPVFLDALALVAASVPTIRTVIVGDGEGRAALEEQRRTLHLENIVMLPGQRQDAGALMRGGDLFVLPSVKEGFPWALLEAMAAGTPAISTDVGGVRWIVEDTVTVVPIRDPRALADAILETVRDLPAARIRATHARRVVETRFTEQQMWEKFFTVL